MFNFFKKKKAVEEKILTENDYEEYYEEVDCDSCTIEILFNNLVKKNIKLDSTIEDDLLYPSRTHFDNGKYYNFNYVIKKGNVFSAFTYFYNLDLNYPMTFTKENLKIMPNSVSSMQIVSFEYKKCKIKRYKLKGEKNVK